MRRHLRVARKLARDPLVPRWLRGLLVFGLLPIPGPVDNIALIVAVAFLATVYRPRIAHHYAWDRRMVAIEPADTWGAWA